MPAFVKQVVLDRLDSIVQVTGFEQLNLAGKLVRVRYGVTIDGYCAETVWSAQGGIFNELVQRVVFPLQQEGSELRLDTIKRYERWVLQWVRQRKFHKSVRVFPYAAH